MSGTFGENSLNFFSGTKDFYSHKINQSLRFEDGDANYLKITQGTPTLEKKFTISAWIKLGNISAASRMIVGGYDNSTGQFPFYLRSDHKLGFYDSDGVSTFYALYGNSLLRDPSAWYHVVLNFDSANGTAASRIRMYINGNEETVTGTLPLNRPGYANQSGTILQVGASNNSTSNPFEGYMAEVHFIDGSVLAPTEFAETKAGIWIPKDTSDLTFGNNGFRLKFQDSSAIGDDTSGNGNDLTTVTFAATDVVLDSPTNNFATMNPLDGNGPDIREGNLKPFGDTAQAVFEGFKGTFPMSSGKWYWEMNAADVNNLMQVGITPTTATGVGSSTNLSYHTDAMIYNNGGTKAIGTGGNGTSAGSKTTTSYGNSYTDGDIIGVALDLDSSTTTLTFYKNNSSEGTAFSSLASDEYVALFTGIESSFGIFNFGQDSSFAGTKTAQGNTDENGQGDFYYTPPSGYLACCTANLPNPAIDPAQDEEPADHFNTVLYTGNNSTNNITGVGFQPDWVWVKNRNGTQNHYLQDSVRGASNYLVTNNTGAENQYSGLGSSAFTSFDSDGFSVASDSSIGMVNSSSSTYVAWNWLAGGSAVTNNDGSVTSSVSANTEAGFSIVNFQGTGSVITVGHGLSSTPDFIILKSRDISSSQWGTYHSGLGATKSIYLNTTNTAATNSVFFNNTEPTDSVFTIGTWSDMNTSSKDTIAYCFHNVDGYSKVGTYTGNGVSTDGAFVYTGFRPAFILLKTTTASSQNWIIFDNKRLGYNGANRYLLPSSSNSESSNDLLHIFSNGFKPMTNGNGFNGTNQTYLFYAVAEQPFKYSNAR